MKREGLPAPRVRAIYDRLARVYPLVERLERRVKAQALDRLDLPAARRVLDVGVGPGGELADIRERLSADARLVALDLSAGMLRQARRHGAGSLVQGDVTRLPFRDRAFDRIFAAYVLDLLPADGVDRALREFRRVLWDGGLAGILVMTEGVTPASRLLIAAWKAMYALSPALCAGCRPLLLAPRAEQAGFRVLHRAVIVEWGFPSEVLILMPNRQSPTP